MIKDFSTYTVSDFLTDDSFVSQHLHPTNETETFWRESLNSYPNKAYFEAVEVLKSVRMGLSNYENNTISEEAKVFVFNKIKETNRKKTIFFIPKQTRFQFAAAAAVVLVSLAAYFTFSPSVYKANLAVIREERIEKKNELNQPILIHLPDGSAVKLASKSKISYPQNFEKDKRIVILSGEATFDIAKDPARPFLVYANEVTTKVLGTRFNVKAYENTNDIVVSVEEGKVSVYKNKKTTKNELTGVILLPNQQAIFDRKTDQYNKQLIQSPTIINQNKQLNFEFNETPIEEVFRKIELAYGIAIEYDKNLLSGCQVTGSFDNESLFQKLDIITKIIGGSYEIVEGKILINSRGC